MRITVVDETGASDAFCAGLAVAHTEGYSFTDAIHIACVAGALAAKKMGAYSSLPHRPDLDDFLRKEKPPRRR